MINKIKKVFLNTYVFSLFTKVFVVLVGFLFSVFQARYLGAEIKGQVAVVNSIVKITAIVFSWGLYHAYPYFKKNTEIDVLPIFLKISLLMLACYGTLSAILIFSLNLSIQYVAVLIITPLLCYDKIISYITLIEQPNKRNATDIFVDIGELVLLVLLWLFAKPTFVLGVLIITVKDVFKAFLFTLWWRKRIIVKTEPISPWVPKLIKYGFFPMLSLLMSTLNYRVDVLMLNGVVADAAIGVYSVGVSVAERLWMIPDAMKGVMTSRLVKGKDANEVAYVIRICNSACLLLVGLLIAIGRPVISIIFGADYEGAYSVTLILLLGVIPMVYYKLIASYNIANGKQIISFIFLSIGVVINIIANAIMIPIWGIYGAGVASVISYGVCSILFICYFMKKEKVDFSQVLLVKREDLRKLKSKIK